MEHDSGVRYDSWEEKYLLWKETPKQCGGVKGQCIRMLMMMLITVADDGDDGH